MMLLLVRHAHTDAVGHRLAGRARGHRLSASGRSEAAALARALSALPLARVYTSPVERARETAALIADAAGLDVSVLEALQEVDYGDWTGCTFDALEADPRWRIWNEQRGTARVPNGESMGEVQTRVVSALERLAGEHGGDVVAAVTHADVIKAALAGWLGMPLDRLQRLQIAPASVSAVMFEWGVPRVVWVNRAAGEGFG